MSSKLVGKIGEDIAAKYLIAKKYELLNRNVHSRYGEIDIIARLDGALIFVEVKTRSSDKYGSGEESFSEGKFIKILKTIHLYLTNQNIRCKWQVDLIAIKLDNRHQLSSLKHYKNIAL